MSDTTILCEQASSVSRRLQPTGLGRSLSPELMFNVPRPQTRSAIIFGLTANILFFGAFGAWSALAPLSEAAIAPGVIKVEGQRRTIQHLEGGIVREILVRDGSKSRPDRC